MNENLVWGFSTGRYSNSNGMVADYDIFGKSEYSI